MPYPNEHAARVRDPGDFEEGSFRSKTLPKSEGGKGGVRLISGHLKGETTMTAQSYRFASDLYTAEEAKAWLKKNDVRGYTFEAATGEKEAFDKWLDELDPEAQEFVEAHIHGLKSALIKERAARKDLERRLAEAGEIWGEDIKSLLKDALIDESPPTAPRTYRYWIKDLSVDDKFFVYEDEQEGGIYKRAYILQPGGGVLLGDSEEVRVKSTYTPVGKESGQEAEIMGDIVPLMERATAPDGTIPIKIIQPGWGTTGYYSPGLLERDGPKIFTAGTQMFIDHPTESEERERPERSVRDLAGELVEDAVWDPISAFGPGLYSRAKPVGEFAGVLDQLAPHIGLSINARGRAKEGKAEGKEGAIIQEITAARSVDFVTVPGAGGKILELYEAARKGAPRKETVEEGDMPDEKALKEAQDALATETKAKKELETENARLTEVIVLGKAKAFVSGKLAEQEIPELTRTRLAESLSKDPPVKDGELDEKAFEAKIVEAVTAEVEYLAKLTGSGDIKGLGGSEPPEGDAEGVKKLTETWKEKYIGEGFAPEVAQRMAETSVRGR